MTSSWLIALVLTVIISTNQARSQTRDVLLERDNPVLDLVVGEKLRVRINAPQPPKVVTWYKNGNEVRTRPARIKVTKQWLKIKAVKLSDSGRYACHIVMSNSEEWRNITLAVEKEVKEPQRLKMAPRQDYRLQDLEGFASDSARGQDEGSGEGKHQQDLIKTLEEMDNFDLDNLPNNRGKDVDVHMSNLAPLKPMSLVDISELEVEDSHDNEASDKESGSFNETGRITAPFFTRQDQMNRVMAKPAGNMLRLKCAAEGNPSPNITWFKNENVPERHLGTVQYRRWSIILEDLVTTDSGNYTCLVCNVYGCINYTYKVDIIERYPHKPYIREGYPRNVTTLVNTSVSFECPPISDLEPFVQWMRIGYFLAAEISKVEEIVNATKIQAGSDCNFLEGSDSSSDCKSPEILEIHNVTYEDSGWYTCIAGNSLGIVYASAYLQVVDSMDDPEVIPARPQPMLVNILAGVLCTILFLESA